MATYRFKLTSLASGELSRHTSLNAGFRTMVQNHSGLVRPVLLKSMAGRILAVSDALDLALVYVNRLSTELGYEVKLLHGGLSIAIDNDGHRMTTVPISNIGKLELWLAEQWRASF